MGQYIPQKPFDEYKWFFATKAPTEALGDPAVLLGLVDRMAKIDDHKTKYNSDKFSNALINLDKDIQTTVNLSERIGERNLMRNSSQYWKLFGLIPTESTHGIITLTPLAKEIANGNINQIDFAASMIITVKLPNPVSYSTEEILKWEHHELTIHPFKLILNIIRDLSLQDEKDGWMTNEELYRIVIPMAGDKKKPSEIAKYILAYRQDHNIIEGWPDCVPRSNDKRFSGEYLRFLANFGYLSKSNDKNETRDSTKYCYITELDYQIEDLISGNWTENSSDLIKLIKESDISSAVTISSISRINKRPGQPKFRHDLLDAITACPITGVDIPNVLQAAHIKPHAFGGPEDVNNGLPLRADIHCLFDAGLLNIKPIGVDRFCKIEILDIEVRKNYRELAEKYIKIPDITNMEYVRWRYDNRLLGAVG